MKQALARACFCAASEAHLLIAAPTRHWCLSVTSITGTGARFEYFLRHARSWRVQIGRTNLAELATTNEQLVASTKGCGSACAGCVPPCVADTFRGEFHA